MIFKPEVFTLICDKNEFVVVRSASFGVSDEHMCPYTSSVSTQFNSECVETEFATRLIKKKYLFFLFFCLFSIFFCYASDVITIILVSFLWMSLLLISVLALLIKLWMSLMNVFNLVGFLVI